MKRLKKVLAHLCLIFSFLFLTLLAVHLFNPRMQLLTGKVMRLYLLLFCLIAAALSYLTLLQIRRRPQNQSGRHAENRAGR